MRQAYAHLEPGTSNYDEIRKLVANLSKRWNETHISKVDPQVIFDHCKKIFKYHTWISIDDIEPAFDLGLMGEFGENKGLNSETIFKWFTGYSSQKKKELLKINPMGNNIPGDKPTFIPKEERIKNRLGILDAHTKFQKHFEETGQMHKDFNHYIPVFARWYQMLNYLMLSEEQLQELRSNYLMRISNRYKSKPQPGKNYLETIWETFKQVHKSKVDFEKEIKSLPI